MNGLCWEKYFAPQLWGNGLVAWDARFTLKEIWYKRKTNPFDSFHNFEEVKKALLNFGALFQWVVGHLSEKMLQWCNVYIRGRANLPFPARLKPQKWLYLANTFLAPPPRGVVALVSVSDDKIQITILILRRGALSIFFRLLLIAMLFSAPYTVLFFRLLLIAWLFSQSQEVLSWQVGPTMMIIVPAL